MIEFLEIARKVARKRGIVAGELGKRKPMHNSDLARGLARV